MGVLLLAGGFFLALYFEKKIGDLGREVTQLREEIKGVAYRVDDLDHPDGHDYLEGSDPEPTDEGCR